MVCNSPSLFPFPNSTCFKIPHESHLISSHLTRILLLLSSLSLIGLGSLLSTRHLGLAERIRALVQNLKILSGRVGAGGALGHIRVLVLLGDLNVQVGFLLGEEAAGRRVEEPDGEADNSGVLDGGLGELIGLCGMLERWT